MESQRASGGDDGDIIVFPGQDYDPHDYDHHDSRPGASVEDTTSRSQREGGAKSGSSTAIIVVIVVVVTILLAGIVFFIYRSGNSGKYFHFSTRPCTFYNNVLNYRSYLFIHFGFTVS